MTHRRRSWWNGKAILGVTLTAVATALVAFGCDNVQRSALSPHSPAANYAVGGVTRVTCDVDIVVNVGLDSAGLRPSNAATYNLHITGSAGTGSPSVTATVDQLQEPRST